MNEKNPDPSKTGVRLSLAELLARSMEDDEVVEAVEQERWDEDEGYSGG